jgi:preprotein translocase subunit SecF
VAEGTTDADLREALGGAQAPSITRFGADNEFSIRAPLVEGLETEEVAQRIRAQLEASPVVQEFEVVRTEIVGAVIGEELQQRAALAIFLSFLLTLVYIAFRFEFRFGLASVIATFHDILVILGFLALFRVEISLPTVAAVLTIIGYSLNDTIVVFDRIRENLNKKGGRREDPKALINRSINEVLPRTVVTSGTTLLVLGSLLMLGGAVIRDFTIVLILGIIVGTYSSIFVASPALLEIQQRWGTAEEAKKKKRRRTREKKAIPV